MSRSITTIGKSTLGVLAVGLAASAVYGIGTAAEAAPRPTEQSVSVSEIPPALRDWPDLQRSSKGVRVEAVQRLLTDRGYPTKVDGSYGRATAASVARFQKANRLPATGVMTDKSFVRLIRTVDRGDRGHEVRAVQRLLGPLGQRVRVDGVFGSRTRAAVVALQKEAGLTRDGVVGPETWFILMWQNPHVHYC